jgi:hypothetical protein
VVVIAVDHREVVLADRQADRQAVDQVTEDKSIKFRIKYKQHLNTEIMKRIIYTISIILITCSAFSQDLTDALRYSNYHISGTARSAAMGNAFGALGGDFTSLSINPAGVAVYRSGEFTFTPSFGKTSVDGIYLGNKSSDSKYNIGLDNLGYVNTIPIGENSETGLVSISFGLGFNKLANFSMNNLAEGANAQNSLLNYFTNNANDNNISNYYEDLAIRTNLLYLDKGTTAPYKNDLTKQGYGQSQLKSMQRSGYINEYILSVGANFNHKFYVGATLGIQNLEFKDNANIKEWDANNNILFFNDYNFNTSLKTTGNGFNVKIGAIYKPIEQLRLGIAFHTPTFYNLNDSYDSEMKSSITYSDGFTENLTAIPDKPGVYDYHLETPMRTILSGAYVIGKLGLISVEYEIVDYSAAKLKNGSGGYNYIEENKAISNAYKTVGNLHIGGEYRINKVFSLRAGYENFPSVYKKTYLNKTSPNSDTSYSTVSAGFGFKQGNFFFDAAVKSMMNSEFLKFYPDPAATDMAKYETKQNNVIFTLGYKF